MADTFSCTLKIYHILLSHLLKWVILALKKNFERRTAFNEYSVVYVNAHGFIKWRHFAVLVTSSSQSLKSPDIAVRDILYNQCIVDKWFLSGPGWNNMGEIRIIGPGETWISLSGVQRKMFPTVSMQEKHGGTP